MATEAIESATALKLVRMLPASREGVFDALVMTWRWEGGERLDTLLTYELEDSGAGTVLTLLHERFPNEEAKQMHTQGWIGCLDRLF